MAARRGTAPDAVPADHVRRHPWSSPTSLGTQVLVDRLAADTELASQFRLQCRPRPCVAARVWTAWVASAGRPTAGRTAVVFAAFGLRRVVDVVVATATALPATLAALVCYGLSTSNGNVKFASVIQSHVHADLRGRVFAAFDLIWHSMRLVSLLVGGLLADSLGIQAGYYAGGVLLFAAAAAGLSLARR